MLAAALVAAIALTACAAPLTIARRAPVSIATANLGAIYRPVGNAVCRIVNLGDASNPDNRCQAIKSGGAVENIDMVRSGEATFGLTQSDLAYGAFRGEGLFAAAGPDGDLRTVIALHRQPFTVVARADSGITGFEDLQGKRIGIGKRSAGFTYTRDVVLEFYGWTISDFDRAVELGPAEQNRTLCDNEVDAIIFETAHPDGLTQEATSDCHARLVRIEGPPIDRLLATHAYYIASTIPGGMYADNPDDIPTFGTQAVLVTTRRQSDEVAYAVVKAVFENFAAFRRLHPVLQTIEMRNMVPSETVMPIHPGALKYYREIGMLP